MASGARERMLLAMLLLPCEVYHAWITAFEEAEDAYLAWCEAPPDERESAYAVYRAAADREDAAAAHWLELR